MRQMISQPTRPRERRSGMKDRKEGTIRSTLSRLKKRGLVTNKNNVWQITEAGRRYCEEKIFRKAQRKKDAERVKNMIVIFDVPEKEKYKRDWLRRELAGMGFTVLQKSVWFGPSPLSQDFVRSAGEMSVLQYMKFFEAKIEEIV